MKRVLLILLIVALQQSLCAQSRLTTDNFSFLPGTWKGNLTRTDSATGQLVTTQADLFVNVVETGRKYIFSHRYPGNADANYTDTIRIDLTNGLFNGKKITLVSNARTGQAEFVTEYQESFQPVLTRLTYHLDQRMFTIKKESQVGGTGQWLKEYEYVYWRGDKKTSR